MTNHYKTPEAVEVGMAKNVILGHVHIELEVVAVNNYETPEVFDLGKTKEVILGQKPVTQERDPETGEPCYDVATEEQFM